MNKGTKIAVVVIPLLAVLVLGAYFNRSTIHVTNIPAKVALETEVSTALTPEQMISKVMSRIEKDSVAHMESVNDFNEYADFFKEEVDKMQKVLEEKAEVASSTSADLDNSTKAYMTLREQFNF